MIGPSPEDRLTWMFRTATCRRPDAAELAELTVDLPRPGGEVRRDADAAKKLIPVGEIEARRGRSRRPNLAAYTMIANLILNLDEVLTKG